MTFFSKLYTCKRGGPPPHTGGGPPFSKRSRPLLVTLKRSSAASVCSFVASTFSDIRATTLLPRRGIWLEDGYLPGGGANNGGRVVLLHELLIDLLLLDSEASGKRRETEPSFFLLFLSRIDREYL